MDAIRALARETAGYQDVPAVSADTPVQRSGFVDVERHAWDSADADRLPDAARPFAPTHTYVAYAPVPRDGLWEPERYEFMVVGKSAYVRDSWERGAPPDVRIAPDGSWWHRTAGRLFDPGDAPVPLPQIGRAHV